MTADVYSEGLNDLACESTEECFRAVLRADTRPLDAQINTLRAIYQHDPDSMWAKRARLVAGVLLKGEQPNEAVRLFQAAQQDFPLLEDYILLWKAEALANQGDLAQAAPTFGSISEQVPHTLLKGQSAYRGGLAWYQAGECSRAVAPLGRAVALEPEDPEASAALLSLADCYIRLVRTAEGLGALEQLWVRYPDTREAEDALARLHARATQGVWHPTPEAHHDRARALLKLARYQDAIDHLQQFLNAAPDHPQRDEARSDLALAYARLKQYDVARRLYQELVDEGGPQSGEAAVWLARIMVRQGDGRQLQALTDSIPALPLSPKQRASVLLFLGVWLQEKDKDDQAIDAYRRAVREGTGSTIALKALWRIGWIHYRNGHFRQAVEAFQEGAERKVENGWTPRFLYWMARALEGQEESQATEVYTQLCRSYPLTYYGQLVRACAQAMQVDPQSENGKADRRREQALTELHEEAHYRKGIELMTLGLDDEAAEELTWVARNKARHAWALLELSIRLSDAGAYHEALRLAMIYFPDTLDGGRRSASTSFWRVAYPTGYLPVIRSFAENKVDPYLVAAIIREESLYDSRALSPAGAVGLMQIMPSTAARLANGLADLDEIRDRLYDSRTNIRLGSQYLGTLLDRFSGNVIHAIASYNAGPVAVSSWIRRNGTAEPIEFIELIPYKETRGYVKRVLRSYREYHRLENGGCAAGSLDKAC